MRVKRNKVWPKVLGAVLIVALVASVGTWYILGSKEDEEVYVEAEVKQSSLPTVAFDIQGYRMNHLNAYTIPMEITAAREVLTPLSPTGEVMMVIEPYENDILKIEYEVTSLDGLTTLMSEEIYKDEQNKIVLNLDASATNTEETVLHITLTTDSREIHYYTRIISYDQLMMKENLDLVYEVHDAFFDKDKWLFLGDYFTGQSWESEDWNKINLSSSAENAQWNGLNPLVIGPVKWKVTDATSVYTSTMAEYMIEVNIEGDIQHFLVKEYFRTSYSATSKGVKIQEYNREVNQILQLENVKVDNNILEIGVGSGDLHYRESDEFKSIAFTQAKELFLYHIDSNQLVKIFGDITELTDEESDVRDRNFEYDIEILDVDDIGNVIYTVYGYVNKGPYEGNVGISLNYYDSAKQATVEKAFVKTEKAFAIGQDELRQSIHYSESKNEIYLLANQVVYAINLETMEQRQISQVLSKEMYTVSYNGGYIAFSSGEGQIFDELTILDIESGESKVVKSREGENVYPLGFLDNDIIIGHAKKTDTLQDYKGQDITPSYEIEIRDPDNQVIKSYTNQSVYVESINIKDRVIYLSQVKKKGDTYTIVDSDYIANNLEEETGEASVYSTNSDDVVKVRVIKYQGEPVEAFKAVVAMQATNHKEVEVYYPSVTNSHLYYVYANGQMIGTNEQIAEAIILADNEYGAVINSNQQYLWRRGARALSYQSGWIQSLGRKKLAQGLSVVEIVNSMGPGNVQVYTGTSLENMCYLINNDQAIGVRTDTGEWYLLTGYDNSIVYYLTEEGERKYSNMYQLNNSVDTIIGTSKF